MLKYTEELAKDLEKQLKNVEIKAQHDEDNKFRVKASVETKDRDDDIVRIEGINVKNYKKNPVILANHMPFIENISGKAIEVKKENNEIIVEGVFASTEMGQLAKELYNSGFLKAVSIGFKPLEVQENDKIEGVDITKSELLEVSFVGVPANPEALSLDDKTVNQAVKKELLYLKTTKDTEQKTESEEQTEEGETGKIAEHILEKTEQKNQKQISINTLNYDDTEQRNWGDVDKSLEAFIVGYYEHTDASRPDELPTQVGDLTQSQKRWITSKTLIGNADSETVEELIKLPVVNPTTNNLNRGGLVAAKKFAPQVEGISDEEAQEIQDRIDEILNSEFGEITTGINELSTKIDRLEEKIDNMSEKIEKSEDGNSGKDAVYTAKENLQDVARTVNEALRTVKENI